MRFTDSTRLITHLSAQPLALYVDGGGSAGAAANIVVMPNGNALGAPSAVEQASAAARERLASTGSSLPGDPAAPALPAALDVPAAPVVSAVPVRASDGTFAPKLPAEIEAENAAKAAKALADAGKTPEQIAAEAKAAADASVETRTPEQMAEAEAKTVEVPGEVDGEPVKIEFDDPALAERVRDRLAIAAAADAITADARKQLADVMLVREAVNVDPVGFVLGEIGGDKAAVQHLVLSLLTQESAKDLLAQVAKLASDPNELRVVKAEQTAARSEYRSQAEERIIEARAVDENLRDVQAVCAAMLPRTITPEQQRVAYADMLRDIQSYAVRNNLITVPAEDIPLLLRNRLTALGLDPHDAAQKATEAVSARRSGKSARRGNGEPARPTTPVVPAPPAVASKPGGSAFVASAASRKAVAMPGGGAGSPGGADSSLPLNPDGTKMTIDQTIAYHRGLLNKGVRQLTVSTT